MVRYGDDQTHDWQAMAPWFNLADVSEVAESARGGRHVRTDVHPRVAAISLGDALLRAAEVSPAADAVVLPDARLSYAGLATRAQALAAGMIGLGVRRGDRVGVLMANRPDTVASIFAIALAGATVVPINIRYRAVEIPFVAADAGVTAIVTSDEIDGYVDLVGLLQETLEGLAGAPDPSALALETAPSLRRVIVLGATQRPGCVDEATLLAAGRTVPAAEQDHRRAAVRLRDDLLLLYTSGTTASPRGCHLSHEAMVRNWTGVGDILRVGAGDRLWAPCPLFHLAAIGPLIACVTSGAAFITDTFFEPKRALALLAAEHPTHLYPAYPPITQALLAEPDFDAADLSSARAMLNVAPPETLRAMQAALPHVVQVQLYGSTEGGGAITYNSLDDDLTARTETCGLPLPGCEVRIVDPDTGRVRADGAEGEIHVRSPGLFGGYANDPGKTAATFDADGWYRTGDRGALDAAGRLRFLGRLKDMLKVGGENVAPAEIEALLMTHPAVQLVAVVGVPDVRLDEVPAAFVELRQGAEATADELVDFLTGRLARFKLPHHMRFVTEWPMSATKVQKEVLRRRLEAELGTPGVSD